MKQLKRSEIEYGDDAKIAFVLQVSVFIIHFEVDCSCEYIY